MSNAVLRIVAFAILCTAIVGMFAVEDPQGLWHGAINFVTGFGTYVIKGILTLVIMGGLGFLGIYAFDMR